MTTSAAPDPLRADEWMDAQGLNCPLPILRTKKALAKLASGQVLAVVTTDPHAVADFQAFCRQTGNALLAQNQHSDTASGLATVHYIRRR